MVDQESKDFKPVKWKMGGNVTAEHVCANVRANASLPYDSIGYKKICICASGPSLARNIKKIRELFLQGYHVAAMNGSYNFLIENGIVPYYYFQVDSRQGVNLKFIDNPDSITLFIIASQCHPEIFQALEDKRVALWQVDNYAGEGEEIKKHWPDATRFGGAACVGNSCLNPIFAMGYRVWDLFGYDGSVEDGKRHAFPQEQNDGDKIHEFRFGGSDGKVRYATGTMAQAAEDFVPRYEMFTALGIKITMHGDGLTMDMVEAAQQRIDQRAAQPKELHAKPTIEYVPPPIPRRYPMNKAHFVLWKWEGHIPYYAEDVNLLAQQIDRWFGGKYEIVLMTDDPLDPDIDGGIRIEEMPTAKFESGRDWHRLAIFSEEFIDIIGSRFTSMDLDTVITGPIRDLLEGEDVPFKAWKDPNRDQYCTSLFTMDTGAYPHVWYAFNEGKALALRQAGIYGGYDQAWISYALPGAPRWTKADGVLSFRHDILNGEDLANASGENLVLPKKTKIVNFHGKYNPRDQAVHMVMPWVEEYRYCSPGITEA